MTDSSLPGFYRLSLEERRRRIAELTRLDDADLAVIRGDAGLSAEQADRMVENALGTLALPFGVCTNLRINGRDRLVPMVVEEPSVVAAASNAAKLLRAGGGLTIETTPPLMVGQIQVLEVPDPRAAEAALRTSAAVLVAKANEGHHQLIALGGGALDLEVRHLPRMDEEDPCGDMLVVHLIVDVRDAMGANAINGMCERIAGDVERLTGGRVRLRILSNLSDRRLVTVTGAVPYAELEGKGCESGEALAKGIEEASVFAERDPYRAATHNKGIMNGVDAALIALGQDWRAIESGAHAFAARNGRYTALATWRARDGALHGRLEIPMAVGTVGGVVRVHPTVKVALRMAEVESAADLAALVAAVGLAQNLGALRALSAEGIQKGHMRLHARNVAVEAGAVGEEVHHVAALIAERGAVRLDAARAALAEIRG